LCRAGGWWPSITERPDPDGEGHGWPPDSYRPVAATCVVWPPSCELEHGDDDGEIEAGKQSREVAAHVSRLNLLMGLDAAANRIGWARPCRPAERRALSLLVAMFMCPLSVLLLDSGQYVRVTGANAMDILLPPAEALELALQS
jgi:hypothetical protein